MAKQLNQSATVNMVFTADASQAKAQIASLQKDLSNLMTSALSDKGITSSITGATTEIAKLKTVLTNSTNELGRLDLTKFQKNLAASGTNIQQLGQSLNSLGANGQIAFSKLVTSITRAEMPLKTTNKLLDEMKITLLNSARWTIASSAIKGVQTAISSAYNYAQDLNSSLTDIRIVSGKSADEMARFAQEANKAAKELNTTTRNYSDASLIYFQQGLAEDAVKQRTDITIKMANAAGESAEKVSSQLTAVWNNFDDGSKSLEYFADVMVKLGAYTASSTDEISAGLQKFAPIAKTVGLSYEYAASAIATITATTRESADTVGTSLKTIFSRIQGLSLGETLEDGTDLNKYSKALKTIGIDIKDAGGNLKDMDIILDEMGAKWDTLTRAEKMATAETVGGARQYTQLMNLMENWDYFQELVSVSKNSTGTLNEQAQVYAESWEAASKKVKASLEGLWDTLINEKFFIGLTNTFGDLIGLVNAFASSLNGLPGLLNLVSLSMVKAFGPSITTTIDDAVYKLYRTTPEGQQEDKKIKLDAAAQLVAQQNTNTTSGRMAANAYREQEIVQRELINNAEKLNSVQRQVLATLQDQHGVLVENAISSGDSLEQTERELSVLTRRTKGEVAQTIKNNRQGITNPTSTSDYRAVNNQINDMRSNAQFAGALAGIQNNLKGFNVDTPIAELQRFKGEALKILTELEKSPEFKLSTQLQAEFDRVKTLLNPSAFHGIDTALNQVKVSNLSNELLKVYDSMGSTQQATQDLAIAFERCGYSTQVARAMAESFSNTTGTLEQKTEAAARAMLELDAATQTIIKEANQAEVAFVTFGQAFTSFTSGALSLGMGIQTMIGAFKTLKNPDISGFEKILSVSTSILMTSSMLTQSFQTLKVGISNFKSIQTGLASVTAITNTLTSATVANSQATLSAVGAEELWALAKNKNNKANIQELVTRLGGLTGINAEAMAKEMVAAATWKEEAARRANIKTMVLEKAARLGVLAVAMLAIAGAVKLVVDATNNAEATTNRYNTALSKQQELLTELNAQYQEIKNGYDDLTTGYDNWVSASDKLKNLTKGTVEYKETLLEANQAVADLITNNKNLSAHYEGDRLVLEQSYNKVQQEQLQQMEETQNEIMLQTAEIKKSSSTIDNLEFLRQNDGTAQDTIKSLSAGAIAGIIGGAVATGVATIFTGGLALPLLTGAIAAAGTYAGFTTDNATNKANKEDRQLKALDILSKVYAKGEGNSTVFNSEQSIKDFIDNNRNALSLEEQNYLDKALNDGDLVSSLLENASETDALLTSLSETNSYLAQIAAETLPEADKSQIDEQLAQKGVTSSYAKNQAYGAYGLQREEDLQEVRAAEGRNKKLSAMVKLAGNQEELQEIEKAFLANGDYFGWNAKGTAQKYGQRVLGKDFGEVQKNSDGTYDFYDKQGQLKISGKTITSIDTEQAEAIYDDKISSRKKAKAADFGEDAYLTWAQNIEKAQEGGIVKSSADNIDDETKSTIAELEAAYAKAAPEIQAQLDLEDFTSLDELTAAIDKLQAEADSNPVSIRIRLENISSALNDLKENMTTAELTQFFQDHANLNWGQDGNITQGEFAAMDYEGRQSYLQGQARIDAYNAQGSYLSGQSIEDLQSDMDFYQARVDSAKAYNSEESIEFWQSKLDEVSEKLLEAANSLNDASQGLRDSMSDEIDWDSAKAVAQNTMDYFADKAASMEEQSYENMDTEHPENMTQDEKDYNADVLDNNWAKAQYEALSENVTLMEQWAADQQQLQRGVTKLADGYKDICKLLDNNDETTADWAEGMKNAQEALADIFNVNIDKIPKGFVKAAKAAGSLAKIASGDKKSVAQGLNEINKAWNQKNFAETFAKGLTKAGKQAGKTAQDILDSASSFEDYENAFKAAISGEGGIADQMGMTENEVIARLNSINDWMLANPGEVPPVEDAAFLESLAMMAYSAGASLDDIQNMFSNFGGATLQIEPVTADINDSIAYNYPSAHDWKDQYNAIHTEPLDPVNQTYTATGKVTGFKITGVADATDAIKPGGSGGGGGGGGGQAKTPKAHKKSDMSKRYHRTTERIDDNERKKEAASDKKERGYGEEKIKQAETEIKLQKERIELQKEYVEEAAKYLAEDRKTLEDFAASVEDITGMKLEFDNSGVILNFREMEQALLDYENHLIDLENAGMEGPWLELEQRRVDDMREYMDRYEETLNLYEEQLQEMFNQADELDQLYLELTDIKVVLKVDVAEDKLSFMEYLLGKIEDNAYKVADAMGYLGQETSAAMDKIIAYRQGIDEIMRRRMDINDDGKLMDAFYNGTITAADLVGLGFTQDDIDKIREYRDGLIEAMETLNEMRTNALDKLVDSFDSFNEQLEGQTATLEHHVSVLEAYKDIVDLIGTHNILQGRQILAQLNNAQLGAVRAQLGESKNVYDTLLAQRDEYKRAMEDAVIAGNEEAARLWQQRLVDINDTVNSAKETYLSNFQDALDTAIDIFSDSVELAAEDFDKLLSPIYNTIDALQDAYDRQETVDNDYVQDYEKYYALQKNLRTLDEAIDDTDSIAAKNRLLKIQQEINNYKAEDVKLSQYDLDALEKRIELEKARIALEEDTDASTVALTRDSEGNWGYVYTVDEDDVRQKEQEYEDKLKEYQDLNKDYINDLQKQILDFEAETRDAIKDVWQDTTLSESEKLTQIQQIYETAQQHMADLNQQMNNALANQAGTYELAIDRYKTSNLELIDSFEETRLSMLTGFKSTDEVMNSFNTALESYIVQLRKLQQEYEQNVDDIKKEADIQDWAKTITDEINKIGVESEEASANINKLSKDMDEAFKNGVKAAEDFEKQYGEMIDHMVSENERFIASLTNMIALLSKINTANPEFKDLQSEYDAQTSKLRDGKISEAEWDAWYKDWSKRMDKWLETFDTTGSYTETDDIALKNQNGSVTPEVATLSAEDRAMLNSVVTNGTVMMAQGVGALDAAATITQGNETVVQQTVSITAEFPNVSDSNEITEALNNIINDASQYANRKDENF